jgi:hypothetical protein
MTTSISKSISDFYRVYRKDFDFSREEAVVDSRTNYGLRWYRKVDDLRLGPKDTCFLTITQENQRVVMLNLRRASEKRNATYIYAVATLEQIPGMLRVRSSLFEILSPLLPFKPYFDVDRKKETDRKWTRTEIVAVLEPEFPGGDFAISGNDDSASFHVVVINYKINFNQLHHLKAIAEANKWDHCIYGNFRAMKFVNQKKAEKVGDKAWQENLSGHALELHMIQGFWAEHVTEYAGAPQPEFKKIDIKADIAPFTAPSGFRYVNSAMRERLMAVPAEKCSFNACWNIMRCFKHNARLPLADFLSWVSRKVNADTTPEMWAKQWDLSLYPTQDNFLDTIFATRSDVVVDGVLQRFIDGTKFDREYIDDQYYEVKYVDLSKRFIVLPGCLAGGKTSVVIKILQNMLQDEEIYVVWATVRVSLTHDMEGRFKSSFKVFNYQRGMATFSSDQNMLLWSPQSMHKMSLSKTPLVPSYVEKLCSTKKTFLVLDESELMLNDFVNKALHTAGPDDNRLANMKSLRYLLEHAEKTFLLDALMSAASVNLVKNFIAEHPDKQWGMQVLDNTIREDLRYSLRLVNNRKATQRLGESLKNGETLYIFCAHTKLGPMKKDSSGMFKPRNMSVEFLIQYLTETFGLVEGRSLLVYTNHNRKKAQLDQMNLELGDVEHYWAKPEVRVVLTSSKISAGVNFALKGKFDRIIAFYDEFLDPRTFAQAIVRVRHPASREIICNYRVNTWRKPNAPVLIPEIFDPVMAKVYDDQRNEIFGNLNHTREMFFYMMQLARIRVLPTDEAELLGTDPVDIAISSHDFEAKWSYSDAWEDNAYVEELLNRDAEDWDFSEKRLERRMYYHWRDIRSLVKVKDVDPKEIAERYYGSKQVLVQLLNVLQFTGPIVRLLKDLGIAPGMRGRQLPDAALVYKVDDEFYRQLRQLADYEEEPKTRDLPFVRDLLFQWFSRDLIAKVTKTVNGEKLDVRRTINGTQHRVYQLTANGVALVELLRISKFEMNV